MDINGLDCCGIVEINGLSNTSPKNALIEICIDSNIDENAGVNFAFVLFTGVVKHGYGQRFKKYLLEHRLGNVIETRTKINPNSGNEIRAWIWEIDQKALSRWYEKNKPKNYEENNW